MFFFLIASSNSSQNSSMNVNSNLITDQILLMVAIISFICILLFLILLFSKKVNTLTKIFFALSLIGFSAFIFLFFLDGALQSSIIPKIKNNNALLSNKLIEVKKSYEVFKLKADALEKDYIDIYFNAYKKMNDQMTALETVQLSMNKGFFSLNINPEIFDLYVQSTNLVVSSENLVNNNILNFDIDKYIVVLFQAIQLNQSLVDILKRSEDKMGIIYNTLKAQKSYDYLIKNNLFDNTQNNSNALLMNFPNLFDIDNLGTMTIQTIISPEVKLELQWNESTNKIFTNVLFFDQQIFSESMSSGPIYTNISTITSAMLLNNTNTFSEYTVNSESLFQNSGVFSNHIFRVDYSFFNNSNDFYNFFNIYDKSDLNQYKSSYPYSANNLYRHFSEDFQNYQSLKDFGLYNYTYPTNTCFVLLKDKLIIIEFKLFLPSKIHILNFNYENDFSNNTAQYIFYKVYENDSFSFDNLSPSNMIKIFQKLSSGNWPCVARFIQKINDINLNNDITPNLNSITNSLYYFKVYVYNNHYTIVLKINSLAIFVKNSIIAVGDYFYSSISFGNYIKIFQRSSVTNTVQEFNKYSNSGTFIDTSPMTEFSF